MILVTVAHKWAGYELRVNAVSVNLTQDIAITVVIIPFVAARDLTLRCSDPAAGQLLQSWHHFFCPDE